MNIVIISEGRTELGRGYPKRPPLKTLSDDELGALEIIVARIGRETYGAEVKILSSAQAAYRYPGHIRRPSLTEVIQNPEFLRQALGPCFVKSSSECITADGAMIACDYECQKTVEKAVQVFKRSFQQAKVVFVTFNPEFEVLLLQKVPMERVAELPFCSVKVPGSKALSGGGLKEAWAQCIRDAGYKSSPPPESAAFKARVARLVSLNSSCDNQTAIVDFQRELGPLFRK